ncbi:helix-turn-helix transcriptional regulator [uncultured Fibrobacter sp.]|uniref:helix-turn-helix transcriptional regulator n=1 Tax=uncultured Fibrobacter sp. TaxID=261512 RepID=UPI002804BFBF|nr:helix-turn-helix transcriptional regulator [uncultured Fibrobacter sp.]
MYFTIMEIQIQKFMDRVGIKNQTELANKLGLTQAAVSAWNSGARNPTYEICAQLLSMGMTIEELFGENIAEACRNNDGKRERVLPTDEEIMAMVKKALVSLGEK